MAVVAFSTATEPSCKSAAPRDEVCMLQTRAQVEIRTASSPEDEEINIEEAKASDMKELKMEEYMDGMRLPSSQEQETLLKVTNIYRCMHGSPPLKWSGTLANEVNSYISPMTSMVHDPNNHNSGENIYLTSGTADAAQAVKMWYDEVNECATGGPKKFTDGCMKEKPGEQVGHFTAMIWKGAQTLGCAYSTNNKLIMCRYGGNNRDEVTELIKKDKGGGRTGIYKAHCNCPNMRFHAAYGPKDKCYVQQVGHLKKTYEVCNVDNFVAPRIASSPSTSASGDNSSPSTSGSGGNSCGSGCIKVTKLTDVPKIKQALESNNCPTSFTDKWLASIRAALGKAGGGVTVTIEASVSSANAVIKIITVTRKQGGGSSTRTSSMNGSWR